MILRKVYLEHNKSLADSGTVTVDIDLVTPISRLGINVKAEVEGTPGAATVKDIASMVSKIELVDGSRVLQSMSMKEWMALNFYEMGAYPFQSAHQVDGEYIEERCYINFGRWLGDAELLLNPIKFKNPQLKITYALTVGANEFKTGTGDLTVVAHTFDDFIGSDIGYLMAKRQYTKTLASSGHEVIDLPCDYPYRFLGICAPVDGAGADETFSVVKLSADADKIIIIEEDTTDILEALKSRFGTGIQLTERIPATGGLFYSDFWEIQNANALEEASGHALIITAVDQNTVTVYDNTLNTTVAASAALDTLCKLAVEGYSPYGSVMLSLGDKNNLKDFIPAQNYGTLKMDLTCAAAQTIYVISQQLVSE